MLKKLFVFTILCAFAVNGSQDEGSIPEPLKSFLDEVPEIKFTGTADEFLRTATELRDKEDAARKKNESARAAFFDHISLLNSLIDTYYNYYFMSFKESAKSKLTERQPVALQAADLRGYKNDERYKAVSDFIEVALAPDRLKELGAKFITGLGLLETPHISSKTAPNLEEYFEFVRDIALVLLGESKQYFLNDVARPATEDETYGKLDELYTSRVAYLNNLEQRLDNRAAQAEIYLGYKGLLDQLSAFVKTLKKIDIQKLRLAQAGKIEEGQTRKSVQAAIVRESSRIDAKDEGLYEDIAAELRNTFSYPVGNWNATEGKPPLRLFGITWQERASELDQGKGNQLEPLAYQLQELASLSPATP